MNLANLAKRCTFYTKYLNLTEFGKLDTFGRKIRQICSFSLSFKKNRNIQGSAYGAFSRRFVEFVMNDQKAQDLLEWSKRTYRLENNTFVLKLFLNFGGPLVSSLFHL